MNHNILTAIISASLVGIAFLLSAYLSLVQNKSNESSFKKVQFIVSRLFILQVVDLFISAFLMGIGLLSDSYNVHAASLFFASSLFIRGPFIIAKANGEVYMYNKFLSYDQRVIYFLKKRSQKNLKDCDTFQVEEAFLRFEKKYFLYKFYAVKAAQKNHISFSFLSPKLALNILLSTLPKVCQKMISEFIIRSIIALMLYFLYLNIIPSDYTFLCICFIIYLFIAIIYNCFNVIEIAFFK